MLNPLGEYLLYLVHLRGGQSFAFQKSQIKQCEDCVCLMI